MNARREINQERRDAIAEYWRKNPKTKVFDLCRRFSASASTVCKVSPIVFDGPNPRSTYRHWEKIPRLRELLKENPLYTKKELAAILGTSLSWVQLHAPKGSFSWHKRGKRRNDKTTL